MNGESQTGPVFTTDELLNNNPETQGSVFSTQDLLAKKPDFPSIFTSQDLGIETPGPKPTLIPQPSAAAQATGFKPAWARPEAIAAIEKGPVPGTEPTPFPVTNIPPLRGVTPEIQATAQGQLPEKLEIPPLGYKVKPKFWQDAEAYADAAGDRYPEA